MIVNTLNEGIVKNCRSASLFWRFCGIFLQKAAKIKKNSFSYCKERQIVVYYRQKDESVEQAIKPAPLLCLRVGT
jgi:hypothetical protein